MTVTLEEMIACIKNDLRAHGDENYRTSPMRAVLSILETLAHGGIVGDEALRATAGAPLHPFPQDIVNRGTSLVAALIACSQQLPPEWPGPPGLG